MRRPALVRSPGACLVLGLAQRLSPPPSRMFQSESRVTLRPRSLRPQAAHNQLPPLGAPPYVRYLSCSLLFSYQPESLPSVCHQALPLLFTLSFLHFPRALRLALLPVWLVVALPSR